LGRVGKVGVVSSHIGLDDPAPIGQCGHDDQIDVRQRHFIWMVAMREPGSFDKIQPQWGLDTSFHAESGAAVANGVRGLLALV
jgi:hypothetical protein